MPNGYHIMNHEEASEFIDRLIAEKFPDLCREPDAEPMPQRPADSAEQIRADFPWLYGAPKAGS